MSDTWYGIGPVSSSLIEGEVGFARVLFGAGCALPPLVGPTVNPLDPHARLTHIANSCVKT
eukprot:4047180-Prymnesium_polylepis.2